MLDAERTLPLLDELRAMGVHLSIDDFGTGYSSLSALQQFPISTLKIDRSFVTNAATDPDDATIIRTIIEMGRSLGLQVIAEGVETEEQRYFLLHSGCQLGQGRLFGDADHQRRFPGAAAAAGHRATPGPAACRPEARPAAGRPLESDRAVGRRTRPSRSPCTRSRPYRRRRD